MQSTKLRKGTEDTKEIPAERFFNVIAENELKDETLQWLQSQSFSAISARESLFQYLISLSHQEFLKTKDYQKVFDTLEKIFKNDKTISYPMKADPSYFLAMPYQPHSRMTTIKNIRESVTKLVALSVTELTDLSARPKNG